jgi:hypothetical protein
MDDRHALLRLVNGHKFPRDNGRAALTTESTDDSATSATQPPTFKMRALSAAISGSGVWVALRIPSRIRDSGNPKAKN